MHKPRLRPVEAVPVEYNGQKLVGLRDPAGLVEGMLVLSHAALPILALFDGQHSVADIQQAYTGQTGQLLPADVVGQLVDGLDEHHLLDNDRYREFERSVRQAFLADPQRPASHAGGAYAAEPDALREQFDSLFDGADGPPKPPAEPADDRLAAVLAPHIDFPRGGAGFARAYYEVAAHCEAEVFVIFGTCHGPSSQRFILTRKDFQTPLGTVETDQAFVDDVARSAGDEVFADEFAHRAEHSIEFQAVFLQYLLGARRRVRIVPILVGSFHEFVESGAPPIDSPDVRRLVDAVRAAADRLDRPPVFVSGADLAHVGARFGDRGALSESGLEAVRREDHLLLERAAALDAPGFFDAIVRVKDRHRICGFPPTYTMLAVMGDSGTQTPRGRLLHYDQAVEPDGSSCVSFAGMGFYRQG